MTASSTTARAAPLHMQTDELLAELRRRQWTLLRWGPATAPALLAATFAWQQQIDVLILRDERTATGYRTCAGEGSAFNPQRVGYQYHACPLWTLRAMLALPAPGTVGAPRRFEPAQPACLIDERTLPRPMVIRPLGRG